MKILIALPESGFDPTECIAPWMTVLQQGHEVYFTTPKGLPSKADERMLTQGFGPLSPFLMTHPIILNQYQNLLKNSLFSQPIPFDEVDVKEFQGLVIPGGHGELMHSLLDSQLLQKKIVQFFRENKPVGAICTGVLVVANSIDPLTHRSILYGRKTTAVTKLMELTGWTITFPWLKDYFRPYVLTIQDKIIEKLEKPEDFITGPIPFYPMRYSTKHWDRQFVVKDGQYLSARWPGDAYRFSHEFLNLLK